MGQATLNHDLAMYSSIHDHASRWRRVSRLMNIKARHRLHEALN